MNIDIDILIEKLEHRDDIRSDNKLLKDAFKNIYQLVKEDDNVMRKKIAIDLMLKMIEIEERKE
jgi:hypothetical protein